MDEFDPTAEEAARVGGVVKSAILAEWRELIAAGGLTREGLIAIRSRLDPGAGEFTCGLSRIVLLRVIERLAPLRGMAPWDDDLWAVAWSDEKVWAGFTDQLPATPGDIEWPPTRGRW